MISQPFFRFVDFKKDSISYVESAPSPRIIKTHLPMSMLPPNLLEVSKVVVVARNVMDVCVSFFHMDKMTQGLGLTEDGCFDDYVDFFISGKPSIYGNYWTHLKVDILTRGKYSHYPNGEYHQTHSFNLPNITNSNRTH